MKSSCFEMAQVLQRRSRECGRHAVCPSRNGENEQRVRGALNSDWRLNVLSGNDGKIVGKSQSSEVSYCY